MQLDWSKGCAWHSLYGHYVFKNEARIQKKSKAFVANVCTAMRCKEK